ncbi:MAG TPA: hypothetical protein VGT08_01695 [Terracidiphilus sp.]|nr:hypothetical protein [Terracidiphilus sp.]
MMGSQPPAFQPNPAVLQRAGAAATPFGFGTPNPYAGFFGSGQANGGAGSGAHNAQLMAALMAGTPIQPGLPSAVPVQNPPMPPVQYQP